MSPETAGRIEACRFPARNAAFRVRKSLHGCKRRRPRRARSRAIARAFALHLGLSDEPDDRLVRGLPADDRRDRELEPADGQRETRRLARPAAPAPAESGMTRAGAA